MHAENAMKTATIPSLRVDQALREAAQSVLRDGESLSSFAELSLRAGIERRLMQREFIARGLASREEARQSGEYFSAEQDRKSTRLNSSHRLTSRMPSSA
jgi:hypothetical protein